MGVVCGKDYNINAQLLWDIAGRPYYRGVFHTLDILSYHSHRVLPCGRVDLLMWEPNTETVGTYLDQNARFGALDY